MILTKYLIKETLKSQLAILFILLVIFLAQQLVRVLGSAVNGNVPVDVILPLLGLGMPTMAQLMLPLSLFLALLLTLGRLYSESEITVMQACGIGPNALVKVGLILSIVTAAIAAYNSLYLTPWALKKQVEVVENAKANPSASAITPGQFISSNNGNFVLFVDKVKGDQLSDIYLFQTRQVGKVKPSVIVAEQGNFSTAKDGSQTLALKNGERFEGSAVLPEFRVTHFQDYLAFLAFNPAKAEEADLDMQDSNALLKNSSANAKAELQWRISLFLAVPLMMLIAIPLSKVNPRQGRFAKIIPALLLYLIYFLLQSSLKTAGINGKIESHYWMILVNILFLLLGIILNSATIQSKFTQLFKRARG
ncbi:LPS export ABC transporter permease LptF [Gallibacterium anatis]|uniref:Lipopolysaccharide export system permease protein LptF n=1 Tax=Gallibacterium anatis TaxID=750 RepID=A0A0A2XNV2_9PAST|nr:LPS export ABC transporter permease LptF [Gallibacterium anatis]KGQ32637.1 lipopolysaccharide ABC transporter permease [Gallibacterium anatis]KGQ56112.1 lipopolysaccharide ABC transporter permease [Gallibacterium anatis str. Avicor]OBW95137.1 lipopolysaccharide ABC transporter permease [Gallibacterium anatis]OBW98656.1 lipopolysaccharide ABC transporter permease [Gallibacterium anatis]HJF74035.1 LPS export ABC transporter permease LptF [Gallibacterium anatis]